MAEQNREIREIDTREKQARPPETFIPAGLLPELVERDPDYRYRWVRVQQGHRQDTLNVSGKMREGWVPVSQEEMPSMIQLQDPKSATFPGMVEHGGHVLCKISKEKAAARRKYYDRLAKQQVDSLDSNFMRENDRRMPLFKESRTEVKSSG